MESHILNPNFIFSAMYVLDVACQCSEFATIKVHLINVPINLINVPRSVFGCYNRCVKYLSK